jgi:hypothetical protein
MRGRPGTQALTEEPTVATESPAPQRPVDWRRLHAFGLPSGSVRAVLALMVFGAIWGLLLARPDQEIPDYLRDLLFIILGHYFAVRGRADGAPEPGPPPLFLPVGTVRLVLIAGFAAVAVVLHRRGQVLPLGSHPGAVTLILVGGFLLGVVMRKVASWWQGRGRRLPRFVEDLRAAVALVAAAVLVLLVWNRFAPFLPRPRPGVFDNLRLEFGTYGPEHIAAAVVGFYFGSRS